MLGRSYDSEQPLIRKSLDALRPNPRHSSFDITRAYDIDQSLRRILELSKELRMIGGRIRIENIKLCLERRKLWREILKQLEVIDRIFRRGPFFGQPLELGKARALDPRTLDLTTLEVLEELDLRTLEVLITFNSYFLEIRTSAQLSIGRKIHEVLSRVDLRTLKELKLLKEMEPLNEDLLKLKKELLELRIQEKKLDKLQLWELKMLGDKFILLRVLRILEERRTSQIEELREERRKVIEILGLITPHSLCVSIRENFSAAQLLQLLQLFGDCNAIDSDFSKCEEFQDRIYCIRQVLYQNLLEKLFRHFVSTAVVVLCLFEYLMGYIERCLGHLL